MDRQVVNTFETFYRHFMLGLRDPPPNRGFFPGNTQRFSYVDNDTNDREFFLDPFEFPWSDREPNDDSGQSDCVR